MAAELVAPLGIPFYLDWKFWSFAVSFSALVISLLPHLHRLKRAKLDCDVYKKIALTHKVGNPNAQLFVILTNSGGKKIRISNMRLELKRNGDNPFNLSAVDYVHTPGDKGNVLMTPFRLPTSGEWGHLVNFYTELPQQDQRAFKTLQASLRKDIAAKREGLPKDSSEVVEVDATTLAPALAYFDRKFKWEPGEYEVTLHIATEPKSAFEPIKLRTTIFESDASELRGERDQLKFGRDLLYGGAPTIICELLER